MATAEIQLKPKDYASEVHPDWCPGCGDFGILNAVKQALAELAIEPHKVGIFSGIGCSGKIAHYLKTYGFHTLHGRVLPVASGAKLVNEELTVLAMGGDGDGYGIGAGYFVNTGRRNLDMTYMVFNNGVYGLTKGQASPTRQRGEKTKSMAAPEIQDNINPIGMAVSAGYTFIARGYAMDVKGLKELVVAAINHKGTSFIDVLQPCPVYNDIQTMEWFSGRDRPGRSPRVYKLTDDESFDPVVHDPLDAGEIVSKKQAALGKSYEWGDQIPIGLLYKIDLPTYEDRMRQRKGFEPGAEARSIIKDATPGQDIALTLEQYR
tara:strand:- start:6575 stop:7534 length:960 start_codon:yes stop_codon:yes gene_type:complete